MKESASSRSMDTIKDPLIAQGPIFSCYKYLKAPSGQFLNTMVPCLIFKQSLVQSVPSSLRFFVPVDRWHWMGCVDASVTVAGFKTVQLLTAKK